MDVLLPENKTRLKTNNIRYNPGKLVKCFMFSLQVYCVSVFQLKGNMIVALILSCTIAGLLWFLSTPLRIELWLIPGPWWRRYSGDVKPLLFDRGSNVFL